MENAMMRLAKQISGDTPNAPDAIVRGVVTQAYDENAQGREITAPEIQSDGFVLTDADLRYTGGLRKQLQRKGMHVLLQRTGEGQIYYVLAIQD